LIEQWETFVGSCEEGYSEGIDEFSNDLNIRGLLEDLLQSPALAEFEELSWVRAEVEAIDDRYRALLTDGDLRPSASWWEARIPRFAGRELADAFKKRYRVEVGVRE
jgi:hypothetical protein